MLRLALVVILVVAVTAQLSVSTYTREGESDSEPNSSEAGPSSRVVCLLDRLKSPTSADIARKKKKNLNQPTT